MRGLFVALLTAAMAVLAACSGDRSPSAVPPYTHLMAPGAQFGGGGSGGGGAGGM